MKKTMKKRLVRIKRNYEFTKEAVAVLDKIKKSPEMKLNDFVSEAVIHYAKVLAEQGIVEAGSGEIDIERKLKRLENHLYSLHFDLIKERIGPDGVKKAKQFIQAKALTEESKLGEIQKELVAALEDNAPRTSFECRVLIREANRPKKKSKA